jgi:hypothetical protein
MTGDARPENDDARHVDLRCPGGEAFERGAASGGSLAREDRFKAARSLLGPPPSTLVLNAGAPLEIRSRPFGGVGTGRSWRDAAPAERVQAPSSGASSPPWGGVDWARSRSRLRAQTTAGREHRDVEQEDVPLPGDSGEPIETARRLDAARRRCIGMAQSRASGARTCTSRSRPGWAHHIE